MPSILSHSLPRRAVLRGLGATVALPFLEALQPKRALAAAAAAHPTRMGFLFFPNGVRPGHWKPEGEGRDFRFSPILKPLEEHRGDLTVLSQLYHANASGGDGHYAKSANWLTGGKVFRTTGHNVDVGGASIDQYYARKLGHLTKLPSLELGTEPVRNGVDLVVNFTRLYGSHISWRNANTPLPCEINPRLAFDRMFRSKTEDHDSLNDRRSVIDLVLDDAKSLRGRISSDDQRKLDEYLESVRSVERRIEHDLQRVSTGENLDPSVEQEVNRIEQRIEAMMSGQADPGNQLRFDHGEHVRIMMDLMVLAFWSDTTRVSTFMFGNDVSQKNFAFLDGVDGNHHSISHHENHDEQLGKYERINRWHAEQFAYMIERMKAIPEGDGTLLDHSMVMFGSSLNDGNRHSYDDLPLVLAGRGNGSVRPGRHVASPERTPLCNLYTSLLQGAGVETEGFGDSTGGLGLA